MHQGQVTGKIKNNFSEAVPWNCRDCGGGVANAGETPNIESDGLHN